MSKFRKKPVAIEAVRWTGDNWPEIAAFHRGDHFTTTRLSNPERTVLNIATLEGVMTAEPGDWVIEGVKGEVYPCKPNIFAATYEPAGTPPAAPEREPLKGEQMSGDLAQVYMVHVSDGQGPLFYVRVRPEPTIWLRAGATAADVATVYLAAERAPVAQKEGA